MLDTGFGKIADTSDTVHNVLHEEMSTIEDQFGFAHDLGPDHHIFFQETDKNVFDSKKSVLLVSFVEFSGEEEYLEDICPTSYELRERCGWSQMTIISRKRTWFRAAEIYSFFDKLDTLGFFDDYDQVIFTGSQAAGYAAAIYSVSAPGATVMLFSPMATADPERAPWDPRLSADTHADKCLQYRFAPKMLAAAREVFVFYDPKIELDAHHTEMFTQDFVQKFQCRLMGKDVAFGLSQTDMFLRVVEAAGAENLNAKSFSRIFRTRHKDRSYLRRLVSSTSDRKSPVVTALTARAALKIYDARYFRKALNKAEKKLEEMSLTLPAEIADKRTELGFQAA